MCNNVMLDDMILSMREYRSMLMPKENIQYINIESDFCWFLS